MRGTSMSTPLIAGAAALVRQYFLSGFYPGGSAAPADQYAPSGAAVKAVLLGGAAGMDGFESDTGLPLAPPPSFRQGFGRLDLARSLPMQVTGGLHLCCAVILSAPWTLVTCPQCPHLIACLNPAYGQRTDASASDWRAASSLLAFPSFQELSRQMLK